MHLVLHYRPNLYAAVLLSSLTPHWRCREEAIPWTPIASTPLPAPCPPLAPAAEHWSPPLAAHSASLDLLILMMPRRPNPARAGTSATCASSASWGSAGRRRAGRNAARRAHAGTRRMGRRAPASAGLAKVGSVSVRMERGTAARAAASTTRSARTGRVFARPDWSCATAHAFRSAFLMFRRATGTPAPVASSTAYPARVVPLIPSAARTCACPAPPHPPKLLPARGQWHSVQRRRELHQRVLQQHQRPMCFSLIPGPAAC